MEQRICVRVAVSNMEHARRIRRDILEIVRQRTTIYHVGNPHDNPKTIEEISAFSPSGAKANRSLRELLPHEID
jgi:hypothetical protein